MAANLDCRRSFETLQRLHPPLSGEQLGHSSSLRVCEWDHCRFVLPRGRGSTGCQPIGEPEPWPVNASCRGANLSFAFASTSGRAFLSRSNTLKS